MGESRGNSRPEDVELVAADPGAIQARVAELRSAEFAPSRRGFDRDQVTAYLHSFADWLEATGLADPDQVRRELTLVGERTSEILTKVEETAREIRAEAQRNAATTIDSAREESESIRAEAAEEARTTRLEADRQAEELVEDAERRAEQMISETLRRRQALVAVIDDLSERRDQIIADANRLIVELSDVLESAPQEDLGDAGELEEEGEGFEAEDDEALDREDEALGDEAEALDVDAEGEPAAEPDTEEHAARTSPGAP
jgi:cell division septum initiation protein DivIVA